MKGKLISFEGIDGCGKSTQARLLENFLKLRGYKVHVLREPGGTPISERIRSILLDTDCVEMSQCTELLLYMAARAQLVGEFLRPVLKDDTWVICDRYMDSSVAYQGYGRGIPTAFIERLNSAVVGRMVPHLTFIIDLSPDEADKRMNQDLFADRLESESREFKERVREGFIRIAEKYPRRCVIVDGSLSVVSLGKVVQETVKERLLR